MQDIEKEMIEQIAKLDKELEYYDEHGKPEDTQFGLSWDEAYSMEADRKRCRQVIEALHTPTPLEAKLQSSLKRMVSIVAGSDKLDYRCEDDLGRALWPNTISIKARDRAKSTAKDAIEALKEYENKQDIEAIREAQAELGERKPFGDVIEE